MAKKGIVLSNGDGKVTFSVTSSVYIEDTSDSFIATEVTASSLKINSLNSNINLMNLSNKTIVATPSATVDKSVLLWNGSQWTTSSITYSKFSGVTGGDLSGSFPNPSVIGVNNVTSGTLPINMGGTGLSIPTNSKVILKTSNGEIKTIPYSTAQSGHVLNNINNEWKFISPPAAPHVMFYTASVGNAGRSSIYTWTRPEGKKFMRIIAQGAGGGGSAGHSWATGYHNGVGGGSGGFVDYVFTLDSLPSLLHVYVGIGGIGGAGNPVTGENVWLGSGDSNASVGVGIGLGGGGSGVLNPNTNSWVSVAGPGGDTNYPWLGSGAGGSGKIAGSAGGWHGGGSGATAVGVSATNNSSGGGSGGGRVGGGINWVGIDYTGRTFLYHNTADSVGNIINIGVAQGATGATWNGINTAKPSKPLYGAGGGGGAAMTAQGQSVGGDGGDGLVLIVCW